MISPLGASLESTWSGLLEGRSGIRPISNIDVEGFPVRFGGQVPDFQINQYLSAKESRRMDGFIQFGLVTGIQAMQDSGIEVTKGIKTVSVLPWVQVSVVSLPLRPAMLF